MLKRGQITIFLILGIVVFIVIGFSFYISNFSAKNKSASIIAKSSGHSNAEIVKAYAESCIKIASEDALFNKIGLRGGYINPDGDTSYGEEGAPLESRPSVSYVDNTVPYYIKGDSTNIPTLDAISKKLANYITVEFEKCFNTNTFNDFGINIIKPIIDYQSINFDFSKSVVNVNLNEEDVSVDFYYPLTVKIRETEIKYDSFKVTLPIRLKALYDSAVVLANNAKNAQPNNYDIASDCGIYDKNGLTNVYLKAVDEETKILQFVDFSTYEQNYFNSYIFQFAVKNVNINGKCVG